MLGVWRDNQFIRSMLNRTQFRTVMRTANLLSEQATMFDQDSMERHALVSAELLDASGKRAITTAWGF